MRYIRLNKNKVMNIKEILDNSKNAVIVSHINPDGDAIGSSIALCNILNKYGLNTKIVLPNPPAPNLREIDGISEVVYHFTSPENSNNTSGESSEIILNSDLIICVDFNNVKDRILSLKEPILANTTAKKILIDHHQSPPEDFYDWMFSDTTKSSSAHMVYEFAKQLDLTHLIDIQTAEALYLGMMTDTGNFTYGNLTPEVFMAIAELVKIGVKPNVLYNKIFNSQTESQIRLRAYALSERMFINRDLKCGYIALTKTDLEKFNFVEGDLEGLVNMPLSIDGIVNSAIFIEKSKLIKISFRSLIDGIDVNALARDGFLGGGHINAAGGKILTTDMDTAVNKYIHKLEVIYNK